MRDHLIQLTITRIDSVDRLEPLWLALFEHHLTIQPHDKVPLSPAESWRQRRAAYQHWSQDERALFVVAESERKPIGYAFLRIIKTLSETWQVKAERPEMETLVVLPEFRGQGVGQLLVDRVIEESRRLGFDELSLIVIAGNDDSVNFYEKKGFVPQEIAMRRKI